MKKIFFLVLALVLTSSCFSSCAADMSDAEAADILAGLVPLSQELNAVFWGDGLPLEDENAEPVQTVSGPQYYPVSQDSPYKTINEIKAAAEQVFSADYLADIYVMAFDGYEYDGGDDGTVYTFNPRFKDNDDGVLCVDIANELSYNLDNEIKTETAKITDRGSGIIEVSVKCVRDGEESDMKITLKEQDGVWLLDSPTY